MTGWDMNIECSKCGNRGIHACTGYMPEPLTPEDEARLEDALRTVAREENREKKITLAKPPKGS